MDVPEIMLYLATLLSPGTSVKVLASVHAARISTPGAVMSGCKRKKKNKRYCNNKEETSDHSQ